MVSSDTETGIGDCCVGTIVWVRRRNGSWWPGKILGPDELAACHLISPRSGTPVKLLGREDASVDWYNLEKSKRVKAFRCGEFDDCIEKAEASQGMPPKKREKYARREDAILHALELEKQLLEKKYGKSGVSSNGLNTKRLKGVGKETTSPEWSRDNAKHVVSKVVVPLEEKRKDLPLQEQNVEDVDDKSSYVRPRMRGLEDLGFGPVLSKYKISSLPDSNVAPKGAPDDGVHADLDGLAPENTNYSSSQNLLEKRKRSQERNMEEALGKRRDKRRPLVQVLECSAKSPVANSFQLQDDVSFAPPLIAVMEQREHVDPPKAGNDASTTVKSDESFDCIEENTTEETETDSSGTEPLISDTYDGMTTLSDEGEHIELIPKSFRECEAQGEIESMSDDNGESLLSSVTFSKWKLKGKRNSRTNASEKRVSMGSSHWLNFRGEDIDKTERGLESGHDIVDWEGLIKNEEPFALEEYWEQSADPVYGGRLKSMLFDVEVQVQSGYQREHVPMISLMSKLNDKAIVGHPIPIETLESLSADDELRMESSGYDTMLQPWRTARRTVKCRVPRVSTLDEEEEEQQQQQHEYAADEERKPSRKGNTSRKYPSAKLLKRSHKRSGLSSSQKIRMLSSIGGSKQQSSDLKTEGAMKPESLATAAVACIPVKLVFSRLHEELVARHQ